MKIQISGILKKSKIRTQLYAIYFLSVILPVSIIGIFLVVNTHKLITNYHRDMLQADNLRVKNILFEITTQVNNISEVIAFDNNIRDVLRGSYYFRGVLTGKVDELSILDTYDNNYAEIESIEIYTDNPTIADYKQFLYADDAIQETEWYNTALNQASVFWQPLMRTDKYGNEYWNLCLIRRIPIINSSYQAVLVIRISDNYLHTRIGSQEYQVMVSVNQSPIFFSSARDVYGQEQLFPIDYEENYYEYSGNLKIGEQISFADVSTLLMYESESRLYICTMNEEAYSDINNIVLTCVTIILVAILIPGIMISFFTRYFTERIQTLRHAMHQASNEDYDITASVTGGDEVSEAFSDLKIMVQNIKQKDADMYEARLKEKEMINKQQEMEFKMLASQINPHFLYNTLETIRMKAFTAGAREVATAIKLLGKSMRYVLENTGTTFVTLNRELEHVQTYLTIQKLRFGDKFDSTFEIAEDIQSEEWYILPLLLQPIVENAVLHGLEEKETDGHIRIAVYRKENLFFIDVSDNGCGMEEEELETLRRSIEIKDTSRSKSIGLYNINQRITLYYGKNQCMRINSEPNHGTTVRLILPVEKMENVR